MACKIMMLEAPLPVESIIGFPIAASSFDDQIEQMLRWAGDRRSKVVCVANVHMLIEANSNPHFAHVLLESDLITPDGMPLVWMMNAMRKCAHERVAGMDILLALCGKMANRGMSTFFLGSTKEILNQMRQNLKEDFPDLQIAGMEALPFRPLTQEEDEAIIRKINQSGAGIVFVSLGCPKQELWMHQHKHKIQAVMVGLGGAFPVYAGIHKWAPDWVRKSGFEWCYRLFQEPKRLWKRYYDTIPPFIYLALKQLWQTRLKSYNFSSENDQKIAS